MWVIPANNAVTEVSRHKAVGHQENIVWQLNVSVVAAPCRNESFKPIVCAFPAVNPKGCAVSLPSSTHGIGPHDWTSWPIPPGVFQHFIKTF
jgi:hypothetical protein